MKNIRRDWRWGVGLGVLMAAAVAGGCNLILGVESDPTIVPAEGGGGDSGQDVNPCPLVPECTTNAECTDRETEAGPYDAGAFDGASDAAPFTGMLDGGVIPAICVKAVRKCARLLTPECPTLYGDYLNDNAIPIATLFSMTGSTAPSNIPRQQSAMLAVSEINSSAVGGIPPATSGGPSRPLVVVQCDANVGAVTATKHLANDLHIAAVVGPNQAEDLINSTPFSAAGNMLFMSPTVPADPVSTLLDNGLTWRDVPADSQRAKLLMQVINDLETQLHATRGPILKLWIPFRTDALGQSLVASISTMNFNGQPLGSAFNNAYVMRDSYVLSDTQGQAALSVKYASPGMVPDIVLVSAQEGVSAISVPFEQALSAIDGGVGNRPYYVATDAAKSSAWLTATSKAGVPADLPTRVRGIGVTPTDVSAQNVINAFNSAYASHYGSNPGTSNMGNSYDAMYSIAYAIAASQGSTSPCNANIVIGGADVAGSLGKLGGPGNTYTSGGGSNAQQALQELSSGKTIIQQGTYSLMQWQGNGDIRGGTIEAWCIGKNGGAAWIFESSGERLDVNTQTISGSYTTCP